MQLDDLDFLLLDAASEFRLPLRAFGGLSLGDHLNRPIPPYTLDEIALALAELFARGDAVAFLHPRLSGRKSTPFVPTLDEIDAGLRGALDLVYELTPQGGKRWEDTVQADWSLYLCPSESRHFRWIEVQSRDHIECGLEIDRAFDRIAGAVQVNELQPWRPVYWKVLPRGYRARYRVGKNTWGSSCCPGPIPSPPWGLEYTPGFHHKPGGLAPRKVRSSVRGPEGEMSSWTTEKLWKQIELWRPVRTCFAAACEWAPRADTKGLLDLLRFRSREIRFAALRELARRRETSTVPPLITLVLRENYQPAMWALGEIGDPRALPVLEILLEYAGGDALVSALARFGDAALPLLECALASREYHARAFAALGLIRSDASRALLERELAKVGDGCAKGWAIKQALGRLTDWRTPERLAEQRLGRAAAVVSAGERPKPPADPVPALVDTLHHSECERRRAAIDLLVEFDARDHLPEIERLAKDPDWQVRASVAYALRQWDGSPRMLARLAKDANPAVRWLAKHTMIPYST